MTLSVEDCMCPICMCIMVEPVTMPCKHTLCYPCFKQNVEEASLACPMCRVRISVWARRSSKNGTLVNKKLWTQIQQLFPEKVEKRQKGLDDSIEEPVFQPVISIAQPGEIRKEYEEQLQRLEAQREEERRKEQEASEALIRQLEEEEARRRELENRDRELAKEISQEVNLSAGGDDSVCVVGEERQHTDRQTRSVSSTSSCSASSSRPPSTIDSMLRKMREAEKLKAADEASRKAMSPYPYTCVSPTEKSTRQQKTKDSDTSPLCYTPTEKSALQNKGRELVSRSLSSAGLSSRSCTSGSEAGNDVEDVENDEDLPSKYVSLGLPSLETTIENIGEGSDGEMFDKDSVEVVERCLSSDSVDSISHEISHFRPIRACPLTPPRKLPSGKIVETPLIRTTPRNLNKTEFGSPVRTLSDLDASSPIMQRRLSELEEERKSNVNKLSKSTCTDAKNSKKSKTKTGSCDLDEKTTEKNQKGERHNFPAAVDLVKDNEVKGNQDSIPSKTRKYTVGQEKSEGNKYQLKKLVIPLEPTFDEDDFDIPPMKENNPKSINSDSFVTLRNQSPVLTKTKSPSVPKKSRKVSGRTKPSFGSPQRTITDWIKRSQDCTGQTVFHIEASCRDDVDGEPVHKTVHGEPVKVSQSGDVPAKRGKKEQKVVKSYPKRVRKPYNPDPMWTSASHSGQDIQMDECSRDSINVSDVIEEEKEELSLTLKSKSKKRTASSVSDEKSKKRRKLTDKSTASSKLKLPSAKSKLKSMQHSRGKNSIFNFCTESNLKRVKEAIENNHCMQEDADFRVSDDSGVDKMTQEMLDRKLAEELARQYEMEVKTGIRFFKLKGTSEEYNFRRKPKLSI